jgi:integrase
MKHCNNSDGANVTTMRKFVREWVEKYPSIARMKEAIAGQRRMGSEGTVTNYVKAVRKLCGYLAVEDPETLLQKFKSGELDARASVDRYIDYALEDLKYAHGHVRNLVFGLKKWLELNGVKVDWVTIELPTSTEIAEEDRAPTKEELKRLLNHASSARDRAIIYCDTASGLRIGTLLSLKMGDVDFSYPDVARLTVERKRGRKFSTKRSGSQGRLFVSWITPEARVALQQYLKEREAQGEALTPESPLFTDRYYTGKWISCEDFERVWARLLHRANLAMKSNRWYVLHVHTLRKFFRSNCVGVDVSFREKWMGHRGAYLDLSYFRAEEQVHLAEYRKTVQGLTIYAAALDDKKIRSKMLVDFARLQGTPEDELKKLEDVLARAKTVDEGIQEFRRLKEEAVTKKPKTMHNGGGRYLVAKNEEEMIGKLHEGWTLRQPLNSNKFLLEKA